MQPSLGLGTLGCPTGSPDIDRLIARAPVLLVVLPLALLAWVGLKVHDEPGRLLAGAPAALVLIAYLRSGRRR